MQRDPRRARGGDGSGRGAMVVALMGRERGNGQEGSQRHGRHEAACEAADERNMKRTHHDRHDHPAARLVSRPTLKRCRWFVEVWRRDSALSHGGCSLPAASRAGSCERPARAARGNGVFDDRGSAHRAAAAAIGAASLEQSPIGSDTRGVDGCRCRRPQPRVRQTRRRSGARPVNHLRGRCDGVGLGVAGMRLHRHGPAKRQQDDQRSS